jgi:hypothetical protein
MNTMDYARLARDAVKGAPMAGGAGSTSRIRALAIAYIDEVNAYWDWVREQATDQERVGIDLAIRLCQEAHPHLEGASRSIVTGETHPPFYCTIKRTEMVDPWMNPDKYVACVQMMLGTAKPLWVHYVSVAREQIEREAEGRAGDGVAP